MIRSLRLTAVALLAAIVVSCAPGSDISSPAVDTSELGVISGVTGLAGGAIETLQGTLLQCTPLPSTTASGTFGPRGGTLRVGPHTLVIPRGALRQRVTITAEIPSDPVSSVRFAPHGLEFDRPASLTLSYSHCRGVGLLLPRRVAYTTDFLEILEFLRTYDNVRQKTVTAPLDHFSRYAIAW